MTGITSVLMWTNGARNRPLTLARPCSCGCDERSRSKGVGYLTVSDADGNGLTVWLGDEETYQAFRENVANAQP
jgi:hypothetical protein